MNDPRSTRLDIALRDLLGVAPELEAAAVVSPDGLPMASALPAGMDEDRVAAMSAALLSLGDRAAQGLGRGGLSSVWVDAAAGSVCLVAAGEAVLLAVAGLDAKAGLVLFEVKRAASVVAEVLATSPAVPPAPLHVPAQVAAPAAAAAAAYAPPATQAWEPAPAWQDAAAPTSPSWEPAAPAQPASWEQQAAPAPTYAAPSYAPDPSYAPAFVPPAPRAAPVEAPPLPVAAGGWTTGPATAGVGPTPVEDLGWTTSLPGALPPVQTPGWA